MSEDVQRKSLAKLSQDMERVSVCCFSNAVCSSVSECVCVCVCVCVFVHPVVWWTSQYSVEPANPGINASVLCLHRTQPP